MGDSILIATQEFNSNVTGGAADFVFTNANTAGFNMGDPLHPIQKPDGKVQFEPAGPRCSRSLVGVSGGPVRGAARAWRLAFPGGEILRVGRISNRSRSLGGGVR